MKKMTTFLLCLLLALALTGCQKSQIPVDDMPVQEATAENATLDNTTSTEENPPAGTPVDIRELPREYGQYKNLDIAVADGAVVIAHTESYNFDRLESFLQTVATGEPDFVRIIDYTTEGDPIITDYQYDGERFTVTSDNTRDTFDSTGIITTDYYPFLLADNNGYLTLSNWSAFYGENTSCPFASISFESKYTDLFPQKTDDLTGIFYSPDGQSSIRMTRGSQAATAVTTHGSFEFTIPDDAEPDHVLWPDESNALVSGLKGADRVYLSVDLQTGQFGQWQEMEFADISLLIPQARAMLDGDDWNGPGYSTFLATEPVAITSADGIETQLQYKTVIQFVFSKSGTHDTAYLYYDEYTGQYLGKRFTAE